MITGEYPKRSEHVKGGWIYPWLDGKDQITIRDAKGRPQQLDINTSTALRLGNGLTAILQAAASGHGQHPYVVFEDGDGKKQPFVPLTITLDPHSHRCCLPSSGSMPALWMQKKISAFNAGLAVRQLRLHRDGRRQRRGRGLFSRPIFCAVNIDIRYVNFKPRDCKASTRWKPRRTASSTCLRARMTPGR